MSSSSADLGPSGPHPRQTDSTQSTLYFGTFQLHLATRSLHAGGRQLELRPKNFDLLLYLLENRGRLITKNECLEQVWPDCVVSENVLTQSIAEIRKTLGDDFHHPNFIKTVPRRGYIFIAEVQSEQKPDAGAARGDKTGGATPLRPGFFRAARLGAGWIFASIVSGFFLGFLLVWLTAGLNGFREGWFGERVFSSSLQDYVVAVIPFEVEADGPGYEWLGRGIADMIHAGLAPSPHLSILSYERLVREESGSGRMEVPFRRNRALELAGKNQVVTGTLRKTPGRVRLEVELIDGGTRQVVSRRSIETHRLDEILGVVEQVSLQLLQDLLREKVDLANLNGRYVADVTTRSLDAYQHYVAALTKFQYGGKLGSDAALIELQKAVRIDPSFAMAHFKIAEIKEWRRIWGYSTESPRSALLEAARHISELPEKERLLIQGLQALSQDDSEGALASWQELERRYPQYALDVGIPVRIVEIYLDWGKLDEALRYGEPPATSSLLTRADQARLSYRLSSAFLEQGNLENSLLYAQRSVSLWPLKDSPVFVLYLVKLGRAHLFLDHRPQALEYFRRARELAGEDAVYLTSIGWSYYLAGDLDKALELCGLALAADPDYGNAFHLRGWIHLARANQQQAATDLGKAYQKTPARIGSSFQPIVGGDLAALYHSGVAYQKLGEAEKARQVFSELLQRCRQNRGRLSEKGIHLLPGIQTQFLEALASVRLGGVADVHQLRLRLESKVGRSVRLYRHMARLCALLGDQARALDWLQEAIERGDRHYQHIHDSPDFDSLRKHARFRHLVTRHLAGKSAQIAQK